MHTVHFSTLGYLLFQVSSSNYGAVSALTNSNATPLSPSLSSFDSSSSWGSTDHIDLSNNSSQVDQKNQKLKTISTPISLKRPKLRRHMISKNFHGHATSKYSRRKYIEKIKKNLFGYSNLTPKFGDATYYGTGLGACGKVSTDESMIAAASHALFDNFPGAGDNPNDNPICGRKVKATYKGASVVVEIVDRCEACSLYDLDFSPAAFSKIGAKEQGRLHGMRWEWV